MASSTATNTTRRERPWLIPSNRKLRHLHGITLRRLALQEPPLSPNQGRTIDDEGLPNAFRTPAKLLALRETKQLGHSRSSNDLRPIHEFALSDTETNGNGANGSPKTSQKSNPKRPSLAKLRRRSTMEWAGSSPQQRQKKLEDVSAARMADIFFSLHVAGVEDAIYVSEVAEKTMNANFTHIDLDGCGPGIMRMDAMLVKVFVKSERMDDYHILLEMSLNLRSLQFIGKELASFNHPFPHNCLIFQLTDGFYTCFTDAEVDEPANPFAAAHSKSSLQRSLPTSSFDALLRLSKLDDSIQDALTVRTQLATELDGLVQQNRSAFAEQSGVAQADDYLKTIAYAKATVEKQVRTLRKTLEQKQVSLQKRRELLAQGRRDQQQSSDHITPGRLELEAMRQSQQDVKSHILQQRRRICLDLQKVYPISPLPDRSLAFTIRNLHLPNSEDLESSLPEVVAAALGHVSHVLQLLSFYLSQPLPYPPRPRSSTSTIIDPLSIMKTTTTTFTASKASALHQFHTLADPARIFPLFARGTVRYRFEYALFLLNKDIEILLSSCFGLRVLDIRQTLPNLLYALYCATAGEGELPARKAGGVRGLLRADVGASAGVTRGRVGGGASMPVRSASRESSVSARGFWGGKIGASGTAKGAGGAYGSLTRNRDDQDRKMHDGT